MLFPLSTNQIFAARYWLFKSNVEQQLSIPLKFSPYEGTGAIFSWDQKNAKKQTAADLISFHMFNYEPDDSEGTHLARAAICKLF